MKVESNSTLKEFICIFDNVLSPLLCDSIILEYENSDEWQQAQTKSGISEKRNCDSIGISQSTVISKNKSVRQTIDTLLHGEVSKIIQMYNEKFSYFRAEQDTGYDLLRYRGGQKHSRHVDSFYGSIKHLSCSFILNDGYEGGNFVFFDDEISYNPPVGSAIVFPSNFMFPHEITPVTQGTRYSIITWLI